MNLTDKIYILARVFGKENIRYADRADYRPNGDPLVHRGYSYEVPGSWVARERCPSYVSYRDVHDSPEENTRVYVDLSAVARGEDDFDQTSTVDRSNFRSLIRDYPDTFTPTSYSNVDALGAYIGNLSEDVISILCSLVNDYSLYDESDLSELEHEEITESVGQYALYDIGRDLPDSHVDQWQIMTDDVQERLFWAAVQVSDYYPEHDGCDVRWSYEAIMPALIDMIETESASNFGYYHNSNPYQSPLF